MAEERRLVTILFADLVGSTAMTLARDPEVMRTSLRRTFDELRPVIEAHGGTVEKFIGDEVMAVFGVPAAHDDDAERAVRAAFAIRECVRDLAARGKTVPLELRIGINSGETVAGMGEGGQFLVTGGPVNAAARIRANAEPGEILVGPLTHRLTRATVVYGERRSFDAKGLGEIDARPAVGLRSDVPDAPRGIDGLRTPLIGRDGELRVLHEALARVRTERLPSLVTVFGAAGAGKSRLITEFTQALPSGHRVLFGRCLPYGEGITFYPLQQILRADAGIELSASRAEAVSTLRHAVESALGGGPDVAAVASRLEVVLGLAGSRDALPDVAEQDLMEELRWGVRRYLEHRAATPLVLVFEDLHWAEPALIELVEHLVEWSRAPLLVACLARPDLRDIRPTFGARAANALAITLSPLAPDDAHRLINELLTIEALPAELRTEIVTRAEGNPLYIEEFLRALIETGRIGRHDGRWAATVAIRSLEIPPTLQGLITARLDRVTPEVKRLLQSASIVGRLSSTTALAAITGDVPRPELLREAARRDLIVEAEETSPGEGLVHRFRHALFREVAYSTIPKAERAHMHDRYARWLEAMLGDRSGEVVEIVAHHAEQAYLHAAEIESADAPSLGARALLLLAGAADGARRRDDPHASWKLYERAATIADAIQPEARLHAHVRGSALLGRRSFTPSSDRNDAELAQAVVLARAAGSYDVLVRLVHTQAVDAYGREGDVDLSKRLTAELPELARLTGDADLLAEILAECGERAYWWGDRAAEERFYLAALEAGRRGTRAESVLGPLRRLAGRAFRHSGDYAQAAEYERESAVLDQGTSLMARSRMGRYASNAALSRRELQAAIDHASDALAASRELGAPDWMIAFSELPLGTALLEDGRDDARARELFEDGASLVERMRARAFIPEFRARAAIVCLRLGDREAARAHVAAAKEALLPADAEGDAISAIAEARLLASDGDTPAAYEVLRVALARLEPTGGFHTAYLRIAFGELLLDGGRGREAREQLVRAREFFRDPLARGWQARIDDLLRRCGTPA